MTDQTAEANTQDEVFGLLLRSPTPQKIIQFHASGAAQQRLRYLLNANRDGLLREQLWTDHFRLEGARIVPISSVGRVTEFVLKLNSDMRLRARQALLEAGRYPLRAKSAYSPLNTVISSSTPETT